MSNIWRRDNHGSGVVYYADRPDGTTMDVTEYTDTMGNTYHNILVNAPDGESEFFLGELESTTVNACIARAESVRLPEEDTGI